MALKEGKLYYSISEVSKHFNVAASLLRYGKQSSVLSTPKGTPRVRGFIRVKT